MACFFIIFAEDRFFLLELKKVNLKVDLSIFFKHKDNEK